MAALGHPHSSAISELMKRAKSVICRPCFQAADSVQRRARPTWTDRGRSATRAVRPGCGSPSIWASGPADRQITAHRHGRRRKPCAPIAAGSETPLPTGTARGFVESGAAGRGIPAPARGGCCCLPPPPHAAIGRRGRVFSCALMPGRPARGRRSQTSTGPTLLRSETEYKGFETPCSGTLRMRWR